MQPLSLYYNEQSSPPPNLTHGESAEWRTWALTLYSCIREMHKLQPGAKVNFPKDSLHALCNARPLSVCMKEWLGEQQYYWFLIKLGISDPRNEEIIDIYLDGKKAVGLTYAHLAGSWTVSFPVNDSPWISPSIAAIEYSTSGGDVISKDCLIKNLAQVDHVNHWGKQLSDWGLEIAESNIIGKLGELLIVMYPLEHGHPHVHLVDNQLYDINNHRKTLAKYRVDCFERMEGRPQWDGQMREWIENNREKLIRGWKRGKQGGHPYIIDDDK